jgi:GNAT superfamily N-acetyltransferase
MHLKSLALKTDLIFANFFGEVIDRGTRLVVKTPTRPDYFWGNYIVMPQPPARGSLAEWISIYNSEFDSKKQGFMTFAVDTPDGAQGAAQEFRDFGFRCKFDKVLTANSVNPPPKHNAKTEIREIKTDSEWDQLTDVHYSDDWYLNPDTQLPFLKRELGDLRRMCEAGIGKRFGAFLDGRVVADLGIYASSDIGRFNVVATHRSFRRQGLCGTLVYEAARLGFETMGVGTLVMVADEHYHAAAIYESVGFKPTQKLVGFEWFDPSIHG